MSNPNSAASKVKGSSPIHIEVSEDYAKIRFNHNGIITERVGDLNSILDVFKSVDSVDISDIFPPNTRRCIKVGNTVYLFMYYEEGVISDFKYYDQKIKIPVPKTLFMPTLSETGDGRYKFIHCSFFPLKETYLNSDSLQLHYWPFPNQSPEYRGRICWGNDPTIDLFRRGCSLFDMQAIFPLFFAARANDDYGWNINRTGETESERADRMPATLKNKDVFPYDNLKPIQGKTIAALIKDLMAGGNVLPANQWN